MGFGYFVGILFMLIVILGELQLIAERLREIREELRQRRNRET